MKRHVLIAVWLAAVAIAVFGQTPQQKPASGPLIDDKRLLMQIEQVALTGTTTIFGDPAKPGFYILRSHLAPTARTRPRYYDQNRWVTVLKGTWWVGQGDVFKTDKLVPVREGGVMYLPANMRHFDVAGGGEVVLQIIGSGPVNAVHAEVDAKGQPVPIGGPYPEDAATEGTGRRGRGGRRGMPPP
jgi:hypothetical protein